MQIELPKSAPPFEKKHKGSASTAVDLISQYTQCSYSSGGAGGDGPGRSGDAFSNSK